jgi:hypothetical protein
LRFALGDFSSPGAKQLDLASLIHTRTQLLEVERQQVVEALEKTNGKIYGSDGAVACAMDRGLPNNETKLSTCRHQTLILGIAFGSFAVKRDSP